MQYIISGFMVGDHAQRSGYLLSDSRRSVRCALLKEDQNQLTSNKSFIICYGECCKLASPTRSFEHEL